MANTQQFEDSIIDAAIPDLVRLEGVELIWRARVAGLLFTPAQANFFNKHHAGRILQGTKAPRKRPYKILGKRYARDEIINLLATK